MKKSWIFSILMLLINTHLICETVFAQPRPVWLRHEKVQNGSWEYYIEKVIDARSQGQVFANLWYKDASGNLKTYSADISKNTISNFMINGLPRDTKGRPLSIRILDCMIRESDESTYVSGEVTLKVQFEFEKDWGIQPLTTYTINTKYTRSFQNLESVEAALRRALVNSLKYIHNWIQKESATNILLAKGLKLSIRNCEEQDADTVYYQKSKSISFSDFQAKPPQNSRFQAAIFPSFGYDLKRELRGGLIHLDLILKVYMIKSASWAFPMIKSNYSLNHEQRHFDLVKLISERFKSKLLSEKLNPDHYEGIINFEYLEFYREMNRLQERYDLETNHGSNKVKQDEWNRWIDSQLNAQYSAGSD